MCQREINDRSRHTLRKKNELKEDKMYIFYVLLYPGTLVCRRMEIDPESDQGLIRSMFNI